MFEIFEVFLLFYEIFFWTSELTFGMSFFDELWMIGESRKCVKNALLLEVIVLQNFQEVAEDSTGGNFCHAFFVPREQRNDVECQSFDLLILVK